MENKNSTNNENGNEANRLLAEVKTGVHKQFVFDTDKNRVECRCGHVAVWCKTGERYMIKAPMPFPFKSDGKK